MPEKNPKDLQSCGHTVPCAEESMGPNDKRMAKTSICAGHIVGDTELSLGSEGLGVM